MELRCQHPKSQLASFPMRKLAELISFVLLWPQGSGGAATDISWELDVWCNNTHQASLYKQAALLACKPAFLCEQAAVLPPDQQFLKLMGSFSQIQQQGVDVPKDLAFLRVWELCLNPSYLPKDGVSTPCCWESSLTLCKMHREAGKWE